MGCAARLLSSPSTSAAAIFAALLRRALRAGLEGWHVRAVLRSSRASRSFTSGEAFAFSSELSVRPDCTACFARACGLSCIITSRSARFAAPASVRRLAPRAACRPHERRLPVGNAVVAPREKFGAKLAALAVFEMRARHIGHGRFLRVLRNVPKPNRRFGLCDLLVNSHHRLRRRLLRRHALLGAGRKARGGFGETLGPESFIDSEPLGDVLARKRRALVAVLLEKFLAIFFLLLLEREIRLVLFGARGLDRRLARFARKAAFDAASCRRRPCSARRGF